MSLSELNRIGTILKQALAMPTVNDLGRVTGQARRLRTVTPHRLFLAVVSALAARRVGEGAAISTRRVAMCAHLLLTDLVSALVSGRGLRQAWRHAMEYLLPNAGRSNVSRERRIGRLRPGVVLVGGA